jgi:hypothetical protein
MSPRIAQPIQDASGMEALPGGADDATPERAKLERSTSGVGERAARSRRSVLAAALAGFAASLGAALARPAAVEAAAGDSLKLGQQNYAGTAATRLSTTSSGGAFWLIQNGSGSGIRADSTSGHGGVLTSAHTDRYGVYAQQTAAAGTGAAVRADGGQNIGLSATSASAARNAVDARHTTGTAVYGYSTDGDGVFGESSSHYGIQGASTTGIAVRGDSASNDAIYGASGSGAGVSGSSNSGYGVRGASSGNHGIYGTATTAGYYGVYASAAGWVALSGHSNSNVGVYGTSDSYGGVVGYSDSAPGVMGTSGGSTAAHFDGICYATEFTTTASPTVRIDHPLAPAHRVLAHQAVISDGAATLYSGTVVTDQSGQASITLPAWFEALNADLRYQLTAFADVRTWVVSEVRDHRFVIASSQPNVKVCWLLIGARADAYASAHALELESPKTGRERGRYLAPVELGQPESAGVSYELRQQGRAMLAAARLQER